MPNVRWQEFRPRPEARQMRWPEMRLPTQRALGELLTKLSASVDPNKTGPGAEQRAIYHPATTLLLSGRRGSGKTTVLLSAALATLDPDEFFGGAKPHDEAFAPAREGANALRRRVAWLPILDMEPLPASANPLATLLVRVRDQLQTEGRSSDGAPRAASLFESGTEKAWRKLDSLVRDATLMWEDPLAQDQRARIDEQVRVAEIYQHFEDRFAEAMRDAAETLGRLAREPTGKTILVQRIDNVDRGAAHLRRIMKLTRMVSNEHLWFVLAAGRTDFQLFHERSYHHDLDADRAAERIRQDEIRGIARRQAAATERKALPPAHWIRIGPVAAKEALEFHLDPVSPEEEKKFELGAGKKLTLCRLLKAVKFPSDLVPNAPWTPACLRDLFDVHALLHKPTTASLHKIEDSPKPAHPADEASQKQLLSWVGRHALAGPARTVVDIYQATRQAAWGSDGVEEAVDVARRILLSAADESDMPAWGSDRFHHNIVREDDQGRPVLHVEPSNAAGRRRAQLLVVKFRASLRAVRDVVPFPGMKVESDERFLLTRELRVASCPEFVGGMQSDEFPPCEVPCEVLGWLMVLYDLLMLPKDRRIHGDLVPRLELVRSLCTVGHALGKGVASVQVTFTWPAPSWPTFLAADLFARHWMAVSAQLREHFPSERDVRLTSEQATLCHRLLLAAWIDCARVLIRPPPRASAGADAKPPFIEDALTRLKDALDTKDDAVLAERVEAYERETMTRILQLYAACEAQEGGAMTNRRPLASLVRWMEQDLPVLLMMEATPRTCFADLLEESARGRALPQHWWRTRRQLRGRFVELTSFTRGPEAILTQDLFTRGLFAGD